MAIYTVHLPVKARDAVDMADNTRFLRDGFSWGALVFGPLWLLRQRLWLELFFYIVVAGLILLAQKLWGLEEAAALALLALINLLLGLEGLKLVGDKLDRRKFDCCDIVAGSRRDDIERRFFARWGALPSVAATPPQTSAPSVAVLPASGG